MPGCEEPAGGTGRIFAQSAMCHEEGKTMFLNRIEILSTAPCVIVPERIRFRARLSDNIQEILPHLNAVLKNAVYNHEGKVLSFQKNDILITIYPTEVTVAKAMDEGDARGIVAWLLSIVNDTFGNKANITPIYEKRTRLAPLVVYNWLPKRSSCRQCGEQTCLAFAAKLVLGERQLQSCPVIWEDGNEDLLESLKDLLGALG